MIERTSEAITRAGGRVPGLVYGTAWKEAETERLTLLALEQGFRGIDTANQRKHYVETGVGAAIRRALGSGLVTREALFVQTKFTSPDGQDERIPYDSEAAPEAQVRASFARSLEHLGLDQLDSYVLHGPTTRSGLAAYDRAVWRAMEDVHVDGGARLLGVSNVSLEQLTILCELARVPPAFVQNRCYARTGWDRAVRAFCTSHGIVYQGFSLLTANQRELELPRFRALTTELGCTPAQLVFRYALDAGMLVLTGTTDPGHMREDLACEALAPLTPQQLELVDGLAQR